ncbi:MAG: MBL fold metallo-hydrolase [Egibacteraceae bacterium]
MTIERLDELTTRVRAPNPSPMTLDGTNTYLLGASGSGAVVVVDPGPDLPAHRRAVEQAARAQDAEIAAVVITHHHADHAEAAGWADAWGVELHAFTPALVDGAMPLQDAERLSFAGLVLEAVHTPGHASDHLCLLVAQSGALLTGDHVLGRGTTVVLWPDGDMGAYLASLDRVAALGPTVLYPGHGPVVADPAGTLEEYRAHRLERERQVVEALREGDETSREIVARVYAAVDPVLHPAAERSVRAHLELLRQQGRAYRHGERWSAR